MEDNVSVLERGLLDVYMLLYQSHGITLSRHVTYITPICSTLHTIMYRDLLFAITITITITIAITYM